MITVVKTRYNIVLRIEKNDRNKDLKRSGGRVKVEFYKVDKHFWQTFYGRYWTLSFRSSQIE